MDDIQRPDNFQVRDIQSKNQFQQTQPEPPKKQRLWLMSLFTKKNLPKTIIVVLAIAVLVAAAAIIWGRQSFSKARVSVDIEIEQDIASGEETVLIIKYKNKNRVNLNNARLFIDYPSGTFSLDGEEIHRDERELGTIFRKSEGEEEFKVRFVGEKGDVKNINVKLNYKPQNINSFFENTASFRTQINLAVINVDISGSEKTISGQEVNYIIEYKNDSDKDIGNLKLELEYPKDFEFISAEPEPIAETQNIWQIDVLNSGEKEMIKLKGILRGEEGENKALKAIIGIVKNDNFLTYNHIEYITQISPSPILLQLLVEKTDEDCNVNSGQRMNYKVNFGNNTDIALSELVLRVKLNDKIFDFKTIDLKGKGFFDSRENTITWSGADVSRLNLLEPGQSDSIAFSIKIKESLPIFSASDKNFSATAIAEIETLTVPAKFSVSELKISKEYSCKINSELDLDTRVYYYEPDVGITNSGPIPPKVDQLTNYTIHWQIANTYNDLENIRVYAILPQGIEWSDNYTNNVAGSRVTYNERTKQIIWEIDKMSAGIGVISPIYELVFQIGLRPSINQVGTTPTLINESSAEGKDTFTNKTLKDFTPIVDTTLPDDSKVSSDKGRVVE